MMHRRVHEHLLSDFMTVVAATLKEMVNRTDRFELLVLRFAANAKDRDVFNGLCQLDNCLALQSTKTYETIKRRDSRM